jgi:hypothetical protein
MAIVRPITKTKIQTLEWGIPITDEVNRLTTLTGSNVPTAWVTATLQNGFTHFAGAPLQYRKRGDMVDIRGRVDGSADWLAIFTLPVGYRPPKDQQFIVPCVNTVWTAGIMQITTVDGAFVKGSVGTSWSPLFSYSVTA